MSTSAFLEQKIRGDFPVPRHKKRDAVTSFFSEIIILLSNKRADAVRRAIRIRSEPMFFIFCQKPHVSISFQLLGNKQSNGSDRCEQINKQPKHTV